MRAFWKKWSRELKYSLGIQISVVLIATGGLFIFFAAINQGYIRQLQIRYAREMEQYGSILDLKKNIAFADALLYDYIRTGDDSLLDEYQLQTIQMDQDLKDLSEWQETEDNGAFLADSMIQTFHSYKDTGREAVKLYARGDDACFEELDYGQKIRGYLERYTDELLQETLQRELLVSARLQKRQTVRGVLNLIISVQIVAIIGMFCLYIRRNVTLPLNELARCAKEMEEGNLDVRVKESERVNNVSTTAAAFNKMAANVKRSMENERRSMEYEKLLNEARFMALQTQTNPHFLFNTLNSISRTITFGRNEQALMMLEALARLMRYNLADAGVPVSLLQELDITNEYIKIQKIRFGSRINSSLRYEESLAEMVKIPRFTLQPLVENSIVHGLEPKPGGGTLVIDVKARKETACIRIFDNGVGMERQQYLRMKEGMQQLKSKRIGIWNTYQRILLFTEKKEAFRLISKRGVGTMVILEVPIKEEEKSDS